MDFDINTFEGFICEKYTVADLCNQRPASEGFTHFGFSRICEEAESWELLEENIFFDQILSGLCAKWRASFTRDDREKFPNTFC